MEYQVHDNPIQLISINSEGQFEITSKGIGVLNSLKNKKICILSITGRDQNELSSFSNILSEKLAIPNLSLKNQSKGDLMNITGIWIIRKPIKINEDSYLLLLQCNCLNSDLHTQDKRLEVKLFLLIVLISSSIIFISNNELSNEKLSDFFNLCDSTRNSFLLPKNTEDKLAKNISDLSELYPNLIWVMNIKSFADKYQSHSSDKYLEDFLCETNSNENENYLISQKENIKQVFKKRNCFITDFTEFETESFSILNDEFLTNISNFLLKNTQPKKILNLEIDGESLFSLIENYIEKQNENENPNILNAIKKVFEFKANSLTEKLLVQFKKTFIENVKTKLPINQIELFNNFFLEISKYSELYCNSIENLNSIQVGVFLNRLCMRMKWELDHFLVSNSDYLDDLYKETYDEMISSFEFPELNNIEEINFHVNNFTNEWFEKYDKFTQVTKCDFCKLDNFTLKFLSEHVFYNVRIMTNHVRDLYLKFQKEAAFEIELHKSNSKKNEELLQYERGLSEKRFKEKSSILIAKLEIETVLEKQKRELNSKKKEFDEILKSEIKKYQNLKNYYENLLSEKDSIIHKQNSKIEKLNKQISQLNKDLSNKTIEYNKEITNKFIEIEALKGKEKQTILEASDYKLSNLNLKTVVNNFQNIYGEFKDSIEKLERDKENLFKKRFFDTKELESKYEKKSWLEEPKVILLEYEKSHLEGLEQTIIKLKEELENSQFACYQMEDQLKQEELMKENYKQKYEDMKKNYQEREILSVSKDSIIGKQKDNIYCLEKKIESLNSTIEDNMIRLNNFIIESRMKADELDTVLIAFEGILAKKREKYYNNIGRLTQNVKKQLEELVKDYKIFSK